MKLPKDYKVIDTIDAHTAGEPLRIITAGIDPIPGETIVQKRAYAQANLDGFRRALMLEPRGHADMYGAIITQPQRPDSDLGVLFMHNEGFSTMCGHGIIALTKVVLDTGIVQKEGDQVMLNIDTPAGLVTSTAYRQGGIVQKVSFINVPSFVYKTDQVIDANNLGRITYDIAFGGAFYAFVDAEQLGIELTPQNHDRLIDTGKRIKKSVMKKVEITHPFEKDLSFLYGTIFTSPPQNPANHSRNVCIFADGQLDRSPTGTGVSARAALHYFAGDIKKDDTITIESILATCFDVKVIRTTTFGQYNAVIPQVTGSAHITAAGKFIIDPADPLKEGFLLR